MNVKVTVNLSGSRSMQRFTSFLNPGERDSVLRKIGAKLKYLTILNFGFSGRNRPVNWKPLSPSYAKRVKRSVATLDLSGDLMRSIRVSAPDGNSITVSTDNEYAAAQQNGNARLPARPFFPITSTGELTPYARRVLETTAALEIQRLMRKLS